MNQFALLHFAITHNERVYQILIQPQTPWTDLEEALEIFKKEFVQAKIVAQKADEEKKATEPVTS